MGRAFYAPGAWASRAAMGAGGLWRATVQAGDMAGRSIWGNAKGVPHGAAALDGEGRGRAAWSPWGGADIEGAWSV